MYERRETCRAGDAQGTDRERWRILQTTSYTSSGIYGRGRLCTYNQSISIWWLIGVPFSFLRSKSNFRLLVWPEVGVPRWQILIKKHFYTVRWSYTRTIIVVNRNLKDVMRCCIDALHVHILVYNRIIVQMNNVSKIELHVPSATSSDFRAMVATQFSI